MPPEVFIRMDAGDGDFSTRGAQIQDVPGIGRSWQGQCLVVLAAVGIVGVASLIDALRSGGARRSALRRPEGDQAVPHGSDEQRS
jgi:hypothetical protein